MRSPPELSPALSTSDMVPLDVGAVLAVDEVDCCWDLTALPPLLSEARCCFITCC